MSRRVIPAGDFTNRFHIGEGMGRLGPNRSGLQFRPYNALGRLIDILLCEGEFTHENFTCSPMGTSLAPTPHSTMIKNS